MYKQIFSEGLIVAERFMSFEEMQRSEKSWGIHASQVEQGDFNLVLHGIHTPRIQIGVRSYSKGMMFRGLHPKDLILLYMYTTKQPPSIKNQLIAKDELLIGLPGEALDIIIHNRFTVYTIAVEKELFCKTFKTFFSQPFEEYIKEKVLLMPSSKLSQFFGSVKRRISGLSNGERSEYYDYKALESELLKSLFKQIEQHEQSASHKKFDIVKVRKYLDDNIHYNISIKEMAEAFNIGERQLYNSFKSNYGMTPKKYMQIIRLNAVNKELLQSEKGNTTVAEIAYKYDFTHMSYFTRAYKKIFNELPSHTLQKEIVSVLS